MVDHCHHHHLLRSPLSQWVWYQKAPPKEEEVVEVEVALLPQASLEN
jgi:hypothetical protein